VGEFVSGENLVHEVASHTASAWEFIAETLCNKKVVGLGPFEGAVDGTGNVEDASAEFGTAAVAVAQVGDDVVNEIAGHAANTVKFIGEGSGGD
jgi:hypothetical protein